MDFNLEEHLKNGISFRKIFRSIIIYSISIFIAFWWADFIKQTINSFLPEGQGIFMKGIIGIIMTSCLVFFVYLMTKGGSNAKRNL
jgi:hypothetical protein